LSQLAKTLGPSYYCSYSLFNKIRDKGKTVSAWKRGGGEEKVGVGRKGRGEEKGKGRGKGGEMTQTLYAHTNKRLKKKKSIKMKKKIMWQKWERNLSKDLKELRNLTRLVLGTNACQAGPGLCKSLKAGVCLLFACSGVSKGTGRPEAL
jgi:hypothetical protein